MLVGQKARPHEQQALPQQEPMPELLATNPVLDRSSDASPSVFPKLKTRILYESAMCYAGIFFPKSEIERNPEDLRKAGELALRWAQTTDNFDPMQTHHIQQILNWTERYDDALILIRRCRTANPQLPPSEFVSDELLTYMNAKRFPEVVSLAKQWLTTGSSAPPELIPVCQKLHDDAMNAMSELLNTRLESNSPVKPLE
ncbi:MAG: hypothetical protein JNL58_27780 [Planctomyces sp.]|nr:hypothetical protein [Planctomyces sp.]